MRTRLHARFQTALLAAAAMLLVHDGATRAFDLQGHRGARGLAPENTLPAFAVALSLGVTTLELDTAITRDGVIVVSHDPFLNPDITRGDDGAVLKQRGPPIRSLSFSELQRFDVGRISPESRYALGRPEGSPWTAGFQASDHGGSVPRMIQAAGGRVLSPYFGDVDQTRIDEAHGLGLTVVVWTVNQPRDIERMLELKVDGIISDRPDFVRAALLARGMPLPKATPVAPQVTP